MLPYRKRQKSKGETLWGELKEEIKKKKDAMSIEDRMETVYMTIRFCERGNTRHFPNEYLFNKYIELIKLTMLKIKRDHCE